jgi:flagellar hook protein FlgE
MSFRIALSGLNAASADLKVTGNNVANAGTTGFKQSRAEFADVFAVASGGSSSIATGNGVKVSNVSQNYTQGSIEYSDKPLDLAISGEGFFVLDDNGSRSFSRAGNFHADQDGTVVNNTGQHLQIFPVVGSGATGTTSFNTGILTDLTLSTTDGAPSATATVTAGLNLDASDSVPATGVFDPADPSSYNASTSVITYDSLGSTHTTSMYYVKSATLNQWDAYMYVDGNEVQSGGASPVALQFGSDGSLTSPASGKIAYDAIPTATLGTGASPLSITLDYTDATQFGSAFSVNNLSQDGYASGRLSGIDINNEGVVFARFTNGQSTALGKVALANFPNQNGLRQLGDTTWAQTFESGDLVLGEAGTGSLGQIQSGALEASNVNISESLVSLITAQRSFQANAQVISAEDQITQTIINI